MSKLVRRIAVAVVLVAFVFSGVALAAEFFVVKDAQGKLSIVDKKPADAKSIVKGPFGTKAEAEKALKGASAAGEAKPATKKPPAPPSEGC